MVSNNSATIAIRANPTDMLTTGKIYKVSVDLTFTTGTIDISGVSFNTSGTKVFYLTAPADYIQLAKASALDVLIDNLSVKQVDPNDRWTLSGTTISNGVLNFPDNSSSAHYAYQDNVLTAGNTYEITLKVTRTSGRFEILAGTGGTGVISNINTSGTHTFTFDYSGISGTRIWIYSSASGNFVGTIDNVSVKEYAIQPLDI